MIVAIPKVRHRTRRTSSRRHRKVLFVGCGTCVTVCLAGGEREVGIAAYAVRMARKLEGKPLELEQITIERQCENEFIKDLARAGERKPTPSSPSAAAPACRPSPSASPTSPSTPR